MNRPRPRNLYSRPLPLPAGFVWCDLCCREYHVPRENPGYATAIAKHEASKLHQRALTSLLPKRRTR